jgi:UDP-N-acetylmuramyl pentapeptide phosphotransferase/UDP-N-acetylglucosamine-1-phosphate transferase
MVAAAMVAFSVTAVLLVPVIATLRHWRVLDHPTLRSLHERATPRGGGVAVAIGAIAALAITNDVSGAPRVALLVACTGFGVVGLAEDIRGVSPTLRLIAQGVVAVLALPWLLDASDEPHALGIAVAIGAATWLVAFANAFNFMDGINGIAAAQALVAGGAWWIIGSTQGVAVLEGGGAILAAAAIAFAPANFPGARVFLGDVGSYFLGAWIAVVVVLGLRAGLPAEAVLGPVWLFVADTGVTLGRRVLRGERIFEPHRSHSFQQLVALGWSHARTTGFVAAIITGCALLGAVSLSGEIVPRLIADVATGALVVGYLQSPRWLAGSHTMRVAE